MPRPRSEPISIDRIDWVKGVILERKKALGLTWADIANEVGMSPEVLRKLISERPTVRWQSYTLKKVCQALRIPFGTYTITIPEERKK